MTAQDPDRLLSAAEVALKLGYKTIDAFHRHRKALEARGFPKPLAARCWDPLAITAWRLSQMAPALRAALAATGGEAAAAIDWEARLAAGAAAIAAREIPDAAE